MKYIVCEEPGRFELKEKPAPVRKPGEALLKITKVGICGTDLHAYAGNQAFFTYPVFWVTSLPPRWLRSMTIHSS